jgi:sec-independent protein translocase protein TatA
MSIGPAEIIIVLVIALLVFGPSRLPQMGRSLGKGVREFRKAAETARTELGLGEITDQINDVKSTIGDLKSSVDLTAAVEAPVETKAAAAGAAVAGATVAATSVAGPETPDLPAGPEPPATGAAPEEPVIEAPEVPAMEAMDESVVEAPEGPAVEAPTGAVAGATLATEPPTGA